MGISCDQIHLETYKKEWHIRSMQVLTSSSEGACITTIDIWSSKWIVYHEWRRSYHRSTSRLKVTRRLGAQMQLRNEQWVYFCWQAVAATDTVILRDLFHDLRKMRQHRLLPACSTRQRWVVLATSSQILFCTLHIIVVVRSLFNYRSRLSISD